jgi:pimeloyl-ACP methyl ester carboxylesterase
LPKVLAAAGIGASILVGHSDGASIALLHAGSGAEQGLRGLVLLAPHVFAEEVGLRSIERIRDEYRASDGLRSRLARHHQDPDNAFWGWNTGWLHPDFKRWNIESSLPTVRVPALLVQGEADEYGTPAHVESIARKSSGPVETLLLPGCGHSPHRDKPDDVLAGIARFVRQLVPL